MILAQVLFTLAPQAQTIDWSADHIELAFPPSIVQFGSETVHDPSLFGPAKRRQDRMVFELVGAPLTSSCRQNPLHIFWSRSKDIAGYQGDAPLSLVLIDYCSGVWVEERYENRSPQPNYALPVFKNFGVVNEGAFDPNFKFVFARFIAPVDDLDMRDTHVGGFANPYDGITNFGGTSGQVNLQFNATLFTQPVAVADESFFRQPFVTIYLRSRALTNADLNPPEMLPTDPAYRRANFTQGGAQYTVEHDISSSAAVVFHWNGVQE